MVRGRVGFRCEAVNRQYEDGYESWSPADAFESGYDRVADGTEGTHHGN